MIPLQVSSVPLQDVKAHLLLMATFQRLHQKVEQAGIRLDPATGLPIPTSHAVLFLARSLQRFEAWITTLKPDFADPGLQVHELPPLDVLMCLHAYMLSPLDFFEDSITRHKALRRVGEFPLSSVAELINKDTLEYTGTAEQIAYWEETTSFSFDIPFINPESESFAVACPRCETESSIPWAEVTISKHALVTASPEYPSIDFKTCCATCQLDIMPSAICAGRFLQDIHKGSVAHTVLDNTGAAPDFAAANAAALQFAAILGPNLEPHIVGDVFSWKIKRVFEHIDTHLDKGSDLQDKLEDIKEAYIHPSNFAIDLSDAVFRQARFIFQMSAMGWLDPGRFGEKNGSSALIQAMESYEHLLRINMDGMIVRWDVDLIFHTHQLSGSKYRSDTLRIIGRVLDHDDKQPQDMILQAAQHAEAMWKDTLGQSYLMPHDPDLMSTLARTVCGGSTGGACVVRSGDKKGGNSGGSGGKGRAAGLEASNNRLVFVN